MLIMIRVLVFLGAIFAATSASALTFGVNWAPQGENIQAVANVMKSKNLRHLRFDGWFMPNNTPTPETLAIVSQMRAQGIPMTVILTNQISQRVRTAYCPGDIPAIESQAYSQTYTQVNVLKDYVNDFELLNEANLYPNVLAGGQRAPLVNASSFNTQCASTVTAVLRGMSRAVSDISRTSGKRLRSIIGVTSDGSVGFLKYIQQRGVNFDVVGFHIYPAASHANLFSDPWFGPGGPLGLVKSFGKPVHINEFNCAETYFAGFTNQPGSPLMNTCMDSLNKHLAAIVSNPSQIEVVDFFQLFDRARPGVCATGNPFSGLSSDAECRFGLMYNLGRAKPTMDVVTRFTGSGANSNLNTSPTTNTPVQPVNGAGTPIVSQPPPQGLLTSRDYVLNLFRLLLGREPATADLDYWTSNIDSGRTNRVQFQKAVLTSGEFKTRLANGNYTLPSSIVSMSDFDFVTLVYKAFLQRVPSTAEVNGWVAMRLSKADFLKACLGSAEYKGLYGL